MSARSSFSEPYIKNFNPNIKVDFRPPIPSYRVVDDISKLGSTTKF